MKFACKVAILDNSVNCQGSNVRSNNKHVNATVALCMNPKSKECCIILFTAKNKLGAKYLLKGNVSKVLTRFISDGKATIQFKQPRHDMFIQADVIQLKSFLHLLKRALEGKLSPKELTYSSMSVTPIAAKDIAPTKLTIQQRSDYPVKGFPRTLETLHINNIKRSALDKGILLLVRLRVLDVSNNAIEYVPDELNKLPCLVELNLSSNSLHKSTPRQWGWIGGNLRKTLLSLNLGNNNLTYLSNGIVKLQNLELLNIQNNHVQSLPSGIGRLIRLKVFICSNNQLSSLPGSIKNWHLQILNIANNAFQRIIHFPEPKFTGNKFSVWLLKEYAARAVLQYKLPYASDTLPMVLVDFLDYAKYCVCGRACFSLFMRVSLMFLLPSIATELVISTEENGYIPVDCYFCSLECYQAHKAKRFRGMVR